MRRVLIIDDEEAIRGILVRILEREGYRVDEAANGEVAERSVVQAHDKGEPFDLLLLDVHMPVMDGLTLHQHLSEKGLCPPVVVMTGDPHGQRLHSLMSGEHTSLLEKPFLARSVIEAIEAAIR